MSRIAKFSNFITESLKKIPGSISGLIKERWDGGYEIVVEDNPDQKSGSGNHIYVAKKTPKAIALCYQKKDGNESKYFWVPSYACKIINQSSRYSKIEIPSYTRWFTDQKKELGVENFLNDYIEEIERKKNEEVDLNMKAASDDVDLILDQMGLYDSVAFIENYHPGYSKFKGYTENEISFEVEKSNTEDLIGSLKLFKDKSSDRPFLIYKLGKSDQSPTFNFYIDGIQHTVNKKFSELAEDKYFNYLSKRCLNSQSKEDEKDLLEYIENFLSGIDWDYQYSDDRRSYERGQNNMDRLSKLKSLALGFMPEKEFSSLVSSYRKK